MEEYLQKEKQAGKQEKVVGLTTTEQIRVETLLWMMKMSRVMVEIVLVKILLRIVQLLLNLQMILIPLGLPISSARQKYTLRLLVRKYNRKHAKA